MAVTLDTGGMVALGSIGLAFLAWALVLVIRRQRRSVATRRRQRIEEPPTGLRNRPKPPWVVDEVLRLKVLMPANGCRKIAATFNHMHGRRRRMTVSKSYVASVLSREGYRLVEIRRKVRQRRPRAMPKNRIWALDLTFVLAGDRQQTVLGVLDHGTRACVTLATLRDKASITVLRAVLDAIERHGKPKAIRTDNEAVLTSWLFRLGLRLLGIRHQRIAPFAPWQNGRIERFFGTLKEKWCRRSEIPVDTCTFQRELDVFRAWYNHLRPHQHLDGRTPAMVWSGTLPRGQRRPVYFSAWSGLLTGFYFR